APAGPLPLWATQNCQNVRGGYSAGRLHVLGTENHRLQSLGLCYRPNNNMRRRRTPDQQSRGLSSGGSCIASWVPGHGSEDGLEQLAEGDATVNELTQPHGARLPAFSRHNARSRGRVASGNDAGRPAAILWADSVDLAGRDGSVDSGIVVAGNLGSLRRVRGRIGGWIGDRIGGRIRGRIRGRFRGRAGGREGTTPRPHAQHQRGGHERQTAHEHDEGEKGVACFQAYDGQVDMYLKLLPGWRTDDHDVIVS